MESAVVIERAALRWPATVCVFVIATWLNMQLQPQLDGRAPLLPYFHALLVVGLRCGIGPAVAPAANEALTGLNGRFNTLYADSGRASIAPEKLL